MIFWIYFKIFSYNIGYDIGNFRCNENLNIINKTILRLAEVWTAKFEAPHATI